MYLIISLLLLFVVFGALHLASVVQIKREEGMTKETLVKRCKELISAGKYDKMRSLLQRHPKLLIINFNELQTELTEYAREVELCSENKN